MGGVVGRTRHWLGVVCYCGVTFFWIYHTYQSFLATHTPVSAHQTHLITMQSLLLLCAFVGLSSANMFGKYMLRQMSQGMDPVSQALLQGPLGYSMLDMDMGGTTGISSMMKLARAMRSYQAPQFGPQTFPNPASAAAATNHIGSQFPLAAPFPNSQLVSNQVGSSLMKPAGPAYNAYNAYSSPMGNAPAAAASAANNVINSPAARVAVAASPSGAPIVNPYGSMAGRMGARSLVGDMLKLNFMEAADFI